MAETNTVNLEEVRVGAVVCVDRHWAIGRDNRLLYNIKEDMAVFKNASMGHAVIMGYNTMKSLPGEKPLEGRYNIVLAPKGTKLPKGFKLATSVESALLIGKKWEAESGNRVKLVVIMGGASVYEQMLPYTDAAIVDMVGDIADRPDAFFPNLESDSNFKCTYRGDPKPTESGYSLSMLIFERVQLGASKDNGPQPEA